MFQKMQLTIEDSTLIAVFAISYLASMYTQYSDPKVALNRSDWIISFLWSFIGGFIAYKFFTHVTDNPGEVMVYTIVISIASPRAFKFISNPKNQDQLINSIFSKFAGGRQNERNDNNPL